MTETAALLSDLCDLISVQVDPATMPASPYLGLEHLESGRLRAIGFGIASDATSQKAAFEPGDVLYGKLRPYLDKAVLADRSGVATTELLVLRPKSAVNPEYLACVVHSPAFIEFAMQGVTGAQHPRTSWAHIRTFELPKHDLSQQTFIAQVLWSLFDLGMAAERGVMSTSSLKRAAMEQLFTRGVRGEKLKTTEIGLVPESWAIVRLDTVADVISTRMSYTELLGTTPTNNPDAVRVFGVKVSDMNAVGNEVEIVSSALDVLVERKTARQRCAPPGAIIFPKRGAAIATNKKRIAREWTVFDPNVIGVVARESLVQRYLFHWFQSFDLRTITEPGPTPQLNKKNLEPLAFPLPPTAEEQQEIADVLDALDSKIDLCRRKGDVLNRIFKSLLHKLMTGEISVDDLDLSALPSIDGSAA